MSEVTLKELLHKFNLELDISSVLLDKSIKYFQNKSSKEILDCYVEHHTEKVDGNIIHVFMEEMNGNHLELIVDEENSMVTELEILDDGTRNVLFSFSDDGTRRIYG